METTQEKLDAIKGKLHLLVSQKQGSRFLQKLVFKANSSAIDFFLSEIKSLPNGAYGLIIDKYGNYFFQQIL